MKMNFRWGAIFLLFFLLAANIFLFAKLLFLGDSILKMEKEISKLRIENSELEKKLSSLTSLQHLNSLASRLGFTKEVEPIYLENLKYARK